MNQQQKKNLAKLTLYCHNLPPDYDGFNMAWFVSNSGHDNVGDEVRKPRKMGCGTSACFAGHGPHAGLRPKQGDTWGKYIARKFGINPGLIVVDNLFNWLFHSSWPNSIEMACKRAGWVLQGREVPVVDSHEQKVDGQWVEVLDWDEPDGFSSFTPDWDKITQIANS
jgi:hypothetical protein